MKLSFLAGAAAGYVLGARAGRERYETIVRIARRFAGSQTVQSAAGVFQAQVDELTPSGSRGRGGEVVGRTCAERERHALA